VDAIEIKKENWHEHFADHKQNVFKSSFLHSWLRQYCVGYFTSRKFL